MSATDLRDTRTLERLEGQGGQVLPLFALFLIVLLGMAALAIDVSRVYADVRMFRAAADAASLAGAQELQVPGSRTVTATTQESARDLALTSLEQRLGGTRAATGCDVALDIASCAIQGTPYVVSIKTPSPTCVTCLPKRSVQVTVRQPNYGLTFARIMGQAQWGPGVTSVAGLNYGKSYVIMTLRPPKQQGSTFIVNDITLDGGTVVTVEDGDVGSNANMNYSGTNSLLVTDDDYGMFYFDPYNGPEWGTSPIGERIPSLIEDPNYRYPSMSGAPTFDDARASQWATLPAVERADADPTCRDQADLVNTSRYAFMATQPLDRIYCYEPGIYQSGTGAKNATITVADGDVALLKPGAYYLKSGLDVGGYLLGGYDPGEPGVALMFDETGPGNCSSCIFNGNNAEAIALNAGTKFPPTFASGTAATAAIDWSGQRVETSGPASPDPPILITLLVRKDPACYVPSPPQLLLEPSGCNANKNKTINMAGAGAIVLEGVQYAPTDNVEIGGLSTSDGRVGQIVSWTLKYSGGIRLYQQGPGLEGNGILRIDAACSAPSEPCNP